MSFAVSAERTHCKVGPRRAQMDAIVVPQEPPPRTTTWGWRWVGVTLTTLSLPPRCPPFVARFSCANSDVAILADSADAGFPRTRHVCLPPRGTPARAESNRVKQQLGRGGHQADPSRKEPSARGSHWCQPVSARRPPSE